MSTVRDEIASRCAVHVTCTHSVISAYESGRRQPSLPTLTRLVEATDSRLEVTVRPQPPTSHRRLEGPVGRTLRSRHGEVIAAAGRYGVSNLRVFGSVARGEETAESDIDLLVDLPEGASLFTIARLQRDLEEILGARVEIVSATDLKSGIKANLEQDLVSL